MKKFKFTLQSLLNVKQSLEKQKQNELSAATAKLYALIDHLEQLRLDRIQKEEDLKREVAEGILVSQLSLYSNYFEHLKVLIFLQVEKISVARHQRQRIQDQLVKLMGERKMLEKLKEKQFEEYKIELAKEDEKVIGDFISFKVNKGA